MYAMRAARARAAPPSATYRLSDPASLNQLNEVSLPATNRMSAAKRVSTRAMARTATIPKPRSLCRWRAPNTSTPHIQKVHPDRGCGERNGSGVLVRDAPRALHRGRLGPRGVLQRDRVRSIGLPERSERHRVRGRDAAREHATLQEPTRGASDNVRL